MLLQNWDASGISNAIGAAAGEAEGYLAQLQNAAIIEFVLQGHSDVDLSQVQGQLISTENITADALALLQQLGLFTVETVDMGATYWRFNSLTNQMEKMTATNSVQVLKPTGGNPLKVGGSGRSSGGSGGGKGGGGGGGGGGSSSAKVSSAVQNLLDEVTATKELYDYRLKLINLAKDYYKATGELRGVIEYTKQEITVTQEQNDALLRNIET